MPAPGGGNPVLCVFSPSLRAHGGPIALSAPQCTLFVVQTGPGFSLLREDSSYTVLEGDQVRGPLHVLGSHDVEIVGEVTLGCDNRRLGPQPRVRQKRSSTLVANSDRSINDIPAKLRLGTGDAATQVDDQHVLGLANFRTRSRASSSGWPEKLPGAWRSGSRPFRSLSTASRSPACVCLQ